MASKNLSKASDWAQREILELEKEHKELTDKGRAITDRLEEIKDKISMLLDIKEKLSNGVEEKPLI